MLKQPSEKKPVLGIYARVSTADQADFGVSLEDQEKRGIEIARSLDWEYEVFIDGGVSGGLLPSERPEFNRLLTKCLRKQISGIFTTDFKRLSREADDGLISLFKSKDIKLFDLKGEVNLHDPNVELLVRIMKDVAHYERVANKASIVRALERNILNGKVSGGPIINYGYTKDDKKVLVIDEIEAETVKLIYKLALEGNGTKRISAILNERKIPTKRGNISTGKNMKVKGKIKTEFVWRDAVIYRILTNPIYKGIRIYKHKELEYNPALDIIGKITFDLVQEQLSSRDQFKDTTTKYNFLLKGLINCPVCGGKYYGHKRANGKDNAYTCNSNRYGKNCGNRGISIDFLDNIVVEDLKRFPSMVEEVYSDYIHGTNMERNEADLIEVRKNIEETKQKINNLLNLLELNGVEETVKHRLQERQTELNEYLKEEGVLLKEKTLKDQKGNVIALAQKITEEFKKISTFEQKREFIRNAVKSIIIGWEEESKEYVISINYKINSAENYLISKELVIDRNSRKEGKALTKILTETISLQNNYILEEDEGEEIYEDLPHGAPDIRFDEPYDLPLGAK